jgi:hypothetical protein
MMKFLTIQPYDITQLYIAKRNFNRIIVIKKTVKHKGYQLQISAFQLYS